MTTSHSMESNLITKAVKESFEYIGRLFSNIRYSDTSLPFKAANIRIIKDDKGITLYFDAENNKELEEVYMGRMDGFEIKNDLNVLSIPAGYFSFDCSLNLVEPTQSMTVRVGKCASNHFEPEKELYRRIMIPIERVDWIRDVHTYWYREDSLTRCGLIEFSINGIQIHLFPYKYKDREYLVFDSMIPMMQEEFSNLVFSICVTLGLVIAKLWQDEEITLEYDDNEFLKPKALAYRKLRPSIKGTYSIFSTNMYSLHHSLKLNHLDYAAKYLEKNGNVDSGKVDWIRQPFMSDLASLIHCNDSLRRAVVLMIEGSTYPLEFQAPIYSVALETITGFLLKESGDKEMTPVPKESYENEIKPKLNTLLDSFKSGDNENDEGIRILKQRIVQLNRPTNSDKLTNPFKSIGYRLTKEEKKAINDRNRFLHGVLYGDKGCQDELDLLLKSSIRLHKLCCILILKRSGFDSFILNNPVLWGFEEDCDRKDPPLILLHP